MTKAATNPAAHLEFWLKRAEEYAVLARQENQRYRNSGNHPRLHQKTIRQAWAEIWGLDDDDLEQRLECYRLGIAMIECGLRTRRLAEASPNGLAPLAVKHFDEVEAALRDFMASQQQLHVMMDKITGTGWHSLELLSALLNTEVPEAAVDRDAITAQLAAVRHLIADIVDDGDLASDLRSYVVDRLREAESALIDARINGAAGVTLAVNALAGAVRVEPDLWDRIGKSKWGPRIGGIWMALMTTLGAAGGVPALMPGEPPSPAITVVETNTADEDSDIVDGVVVDDDGSVAPGAE